MRKLESIIREPGVLGLLFVVSLLLFGWPFLEVASEDGPRLYIHLFVSWAGVVLMLAVISLVGGRGMHGETDEEACCWDPDREGTGDEVSPVAVESPGQGETSGSPETASGPGVSYSGEGV